MNGCDLNYIILLVGNVKLQLVEKLKYAIRMVRFMARLGLSLKYYSRSIDQKQTLEQVRVKLNSATH